MKRALALFGVLALGAIALHAVMIQVARATGGVAALLAPSPAASVVGLVTAIALLSLRLFVIVLLPAAVAGFLGYLMTSGLLLRRQRARGPAKTGS